MSPARLEALTLLKTSFVDEAEAVYEKFGEDLDESGQIWSRSGSNTSTRSARATFSQVTSLWDWIWKNSGGSPSRGWLTLYFYVSYFVKPPVRILEPAFGARRRFESGPSFEFAAKNRRSVSPLAWWNKVTKCQQTIEIQLNLKEDLVCAWIVLRI